MMTLTNSSRKRECSEETDYMPVTKRMNNLHIAVMANGLHDMNEPLIGRQNSRLECQSRDVENVENCLQRNQSHSHSVNAISSQNCLHNCLNGLSQISVYSPQLDSNSNPIYYESNRILFEAHQQRLLRMANTSRHVFFRKS